MLKRSCDVECRSSRKSDPDNGGLHFIHVRYIPEEDHATKRVSGDGLDRFRGDNAVTQDRERLRFHVETNREERCKREIRTGPACVK
jgi:hypothetical protein